MEADDLLPDLVGGRARHHAGRRDGAGVDERIHFGRAGPDNGPDALDRDDRVEARAGGVDTDPLRDRLESLLLDDLRHREHLRDRLDRDFGLDVAGGVDLAVSGDQRDAEEIRIDLGQRGNVVRVLPFLQRPELRVRRVDGLCCGGGRLRAERRDGQRRGSVTERAAARP